MNSQSFLPIHKDSPYQQVYRIVEQSGSYLAAVFPRASLSHQMEDIIRFRSKEQVVRQFQENTTSLVVVYDDSQLWQTLIDHIKPDQAIQQIVTIYSAYDTLKNTSFDFLIDMIFKNKDCLFIMDYGVNNLAYFEQYSSLEQGNLEKIYKANQPPEFLQGKFDLESSKSWGLGIILLQLVSSRKVLQILKKSILSKDLSQIQKVVQQVASHFSLPPQLTNFLLSLLDADPKNRIKWQAIKQHPLIKIKYDNNQKKQDSTNQLRDQIFMSAPYEQNNKQQWLSPSSSLQKSTLLYKYQSPNRYSSTDNRMFEQTNKLTTSQTNIFDSHKEKVKQAFAQRKPQSIEDTNSQQYQNQPLLSSHLYAMRRVSQNLNNKVEYSRHGKLQYSQQRKTQNTFVSALINPQLFYQSQSTQQINNNVKQKSLIDDLQINASYLVPSGTRQDLFFSQQIQQKQGKPEDRYINNSNHNSIINGNGNNDLNNDTAYHQKNHTNSTSIYDTDKSNNYSTNVNNHTTNTNNYTNNSTNNINSTNYINNNDITTNRNSNLLTPNYQSNQNFYNSPIQVKLDQPRPEVSYSIQNQQARDFRSQGHNNDHIKVSNTKLDETMDIEDMPSNKNHFQDVKVVLPQQEIFDQKEIKRDNIFSKSTSPPLIQSTKTALPIEQDTTTKPNKLNPRLLEQDVISFQKPPPTTQNIGDFKSRPEITLPQNLKQNEQTVHKNTPLENDLKVQQLDNKSNNSQVSFQIPEQKGKQSDEIFLEEMDDLDDMGMNKPVKKQDQEKQKQIIKQTKPTPISQTPTIPQSNPVFKQNVQRYNKYLKQINVIGEMVANAIELLEANKNVWIIPLFLIFKRMSQLRQKIDHDLDLNVNPWKLANFDTFKQCSDYIQFKETLTTENEIVQKELSEIMTVARKKMAKLDKNGVQKMENMVNLNMDADIKDPVFVYLYSQIYARAKQNVKQTKSGEQEKFSQKQCLLLQLKIQSSLIILELGMYDDSNEKFNHTEYDDILREDDIIKLTSHSVKLEVIVTQVKARLKASGYTL